MTFYTFSSSGTGVSLPLPARKSAFNLVPLKALADLHILMDRIPAVLKRDLDWRTTIPITQTIDNLLTLAQRLEELPDTSSALVDDKPDIIKELLAFAVYFENYAK